ncbi:Hypothetical_protein [Hexamita inflata]|uniref:Hypothetical_protein n=1 Tax=Hexamita inflata TaxID=28002 RepID=A0ABP1IZ61_9EUKA
MYQNESLASDSNTVLTGVIFRNTLGITLKFIGYCNDSFLLNSVYICLFIWSGQYIRNSESSDDCIESTSPTKVSESQRMNQIEQLLVRFEFCQIAYQFMQYVNAYNNKSKLHKSICEHK